MASNLILLSSLKKKIKQKIDKDDNSYDQQ